MPPMRSPWPTTTDCSPNSVWPVRRRWAGVIGRGAGDGSLIAWHQLDVPGSSVLLDYDLRFVDRLAVAKRCGNRGNAAGGRLPDR